MNVIQVIGIGAKKFGGLERYMLELACQLQCRGDKLIIVLDAYPKTQEYIDKLALTNAEWVVIPFSNKLKYLKDLFFLFKRYKPQIIQTNFCNSISVFFIYLLSLFFKIKVIISTEHCYPILNNIKIKFAYSVILKCSKKMFCVSEMSSKSIQKSLPNFANKVETMYLGVEDFNYDKLRSRLKYNLPLNKIIIGNVAYHNEVKGVDVLLNALQILDTQYKKLDFVVCQIGGGQSGQDTKKLYLLAKTLGIEKKIIWLGIQNNVPEILTACDIYCQPSRSEGIPLSIMEATLANLPIVASNVGGIPEVAVSNENAILIEPDNPQELANAIYKLISNESLRNEMGVKGRKKSIENFNIKTQVSKLINEYYKSLS